MLIRSPYLPRARSITERCRREGAVNLRYYYAFSDRFERFQSETLTKIFLLLRDKFLAKINLDKYLGIVSHFKSAVHCVAENLRVL